MRQIEILRCTWPLVCTYNRVWLATPIGVTRTTMPAGRALSRSSEPLPPTTSFSIALTALERLTHRGGVDADGASGDGAGLLTSIPDAFFRARAKSRASNCPNSSAWALRFWRRPSRFMRGRRFKPRRKPRSWQFWVGGGFPWQSRSLGPMARNDAGDLAVLRGGVKAWRGFRVAIGAAAKTRRVGAAAALLHLFAFIADGRLQGTAHAVAVSAILRRFARSSFATTFAVFHQRYSTNTQPSWHLAQPFRYSAHNGEINTIISNRRWIRAKDRELRAKLTVGAWFQILEENVSDSASFDNAFEQKLLEGYSPEAAMLSMVPPAFENDPLLSRDVRGALASLSADGRAVGRAGGARIFRTEILWARSSIAMVCGRCATR